MTNIILFEARKMERDCVSKMKDHETVAAICGALYEELLKHPRHIRDAVRNHIKNGKLDEISIDELRM